MFPNLKTQTSGEDQVVVECRQIWILTVRSVCSTYKRKELAKMTAQLLPKLYQCAYAECKNRNIRRLPRTCE